MLKRGTYVDVAKQARMLGYRPPIRLAILPSNYDTAYDRSDLYEDAEASTVRKLWLEKGLVEDILDPSSESLPSSVNKSSDWMGPTIFIGYALFSQNPHLVDLAIGVIATYTADLFRGERSQPVVKLKVIVERRMESGENHYTSLQYEGSPDGVSQLGSVIKAINNDQS